MDGKAAEQIQMSSYRVIHFRGAELPAQYRNLLYSKWKRSLRHGNDFFKLCDPIAFYEAYEIYISTIFSRPDSIVRLAVLDDDEDVVLGFSISRKHILDYVHVLRVRLNGERGVEIVDYRRQGIGTALIPEGITTFTHVTRTGLSIWGSKCGHWKFNPFA